jgi:hypothetical protein
LLKEINDLFKNMVSAKIAKVFLTIDTLNQGSERKNT